MHTKATFTFIATTVLAIFAGGSVLMGVISTGTAPISEDASRIAGHYANVFLGSTLFLGILAVVVMLALRSKRSPF
jgi:hypothetical protein